SLSAMTDSAGHYGPIGLAVGAYTVRISNTPAGAVCQVTSKAATVLANTIVIVDFACFSAGMIIGTFTLDGAPFGSVPVDLTGTATATDTTDASGDYGFTGLLPGNYGVAPGTLPSGVTCQPTSYTISLSAGQTVRADFVCASEGDVITVVTLNGGAFPGVDVQLSGAATRSGVTNPMGRFTFVDVPAGSVTATITGIDPSITCSATSQSGTVPPAGQLTLTFACSTSAAIIGTVTLNGSPWAGAPIGLTGPAPTSTTADATGGFLFPGLPAGSHLVTPGPLPANVVCVPASRTITLVLGDLKRADFDCETVGAIEAIVTLDGGPYDGLDVRITGTTNRTLTTDPAGIAFFAAVPIGDVDVTLVGVPTSIVTCTPAVRMVVVTAGGLAQALFDCVTTGSPPPESALPADYEILYNSVSSTCGFTSIPIEVLTITAVGSSLSFSLPRLTVPLVGTYDQTTGRFQGATGWHDTTGGSQTNETWDVFFTISALGPVTLRGRMVNETRNASGAITCRSEFTVIGVQR
ncbi:MAG: hypothetical protein OEU54_15755, partial [Gemmatimonadota bacterium]|nr:hypothetical protein [Gemmatimonadota bacterium]